MFSYTYLLVLIYIMQYVLNEYLCMYMYIHVPVHGSYDFDNGQPFYTCSL